MQNPARIRGAAPRRPTLLGGWFWLCVLPLMGLSFAWRCAGADDPKPTPENTIHVKLRTPVEPQKFVQPVKFFIGEVVDRAGNPQPMLVTKEHGSIFVDRLPADIVRDALESSLQPAGLLAPDAASADLVLNVYLFQFGLAPSARDYFGKVELAVTVKDPKTGASQQISASGTSISDLATLKKNAMKNLEVDFSGALADAVRNLLRGEALRDAVAKEMSAQSRGIGTAPPVLRGA
jgi:hypothetical protein